MTFFASKTLSYGGTFLQNKLAEIFSEFNTTRNILLDMYFILMRCFLFLILLLLYSGNDCLAHDVDIFWNDDADIEVPYGEDIFYKNNTTHIVFMGKNLADNILKKAIINIKNTKRFIVYEKKLSKIRNALQSAELKIARSNKTYSACQSSNVLAFVKANEIAIRKRIYICKRTLKHYARPQEMAQILIHEGAHLVKIFNECLATHNEYVAMVMGAKKLAFHNNYMEPCNIIKAFEASSF